MRLRLFAASRFKEPTLELFYAIGAVIAGFVGLVWGADRFVDGASASARIAGVSPLVIGLTIVGFGTSAPELLVSSIAAGTGSENLSVGNALGSNVANVALVLGVASLVAPLAVGKEVLYREIPVLIAIMVLTGGLLFDGELSRVDGILLLTGLVSLIGWICFQGIRQHRAKVKERASLDPAQAEDFVDPAIDMSIGKALFLLFFGMIVLLAGAWGVVWGATTIARSFGVSELVIGLTVVALGTSLPELASTVISAMKGEHELAIGNVVGSNMFNTLGVLGLPGVIAPGPLEEKVLYRDYPVVLGVTVGLFILAWGFGAKEKKIGRARGAILLLAYIGYVVWLVFDALKEAGTS
ncbi:MAG: calcium/sodium antiporter [Myxococcota bacterium]